MFLIRNRRQRARDSQHSAHGCDAFAGVGLSDAVAHRMTSSGEFNGLVGLDEAMAAEISFASGRPSVSVEATPLDMSCVAKGKHRWENDKREFIPSMNRPPSNGKDVKGACF
ncbi:hypothetical protein B0G75_101371 [Paraburkholderia sp. BL18I3N2]|nr:hypothetical protein B0G75_101371 [Paraburkholderia sp. BL18I3N2]